TQHRRRLGRRRQSRPTSLQPHHRVSIGVRIMTILVTVIHVIACVILVLVVLLQAGKGADMGAVFGGASSTIFGSSGAGNFLTRLTTGAAIVFMTTSLTLTYVGSHGGHSTIMPESGLP